MKHVFPSLTNPPTSPPLLNTSLTVSWEIPDCLFMNLLRLELLLRPVTLLLFLLNWDMIKRERKLSVRISEPNRAKNIETNVGDWMRCWSLDKTGNLLNSHTLRRFCCCCCVCWNSGMVRSEWMENETAETTRSTINESASKPFNLSVPIGCD
ncbi:hypothetical protein WICPIJ_008794 [Wickerhamomyces pijperi]|uniref:Uncharacterized protein n=1 Tax=Wickerhamomyces pijperi TaxID=599730 RepID=A0A9P8THU2_WICPI|nr:hypothetical protein WICPIJ_008794 [Wickerhamomyces pijperi]